MKTFSERNVKHFQQQFLFTKTPLLLKPNDDLFDMTEFLTRSSSGCKYFLKYLFGLHFRRSQSFITVAFTDIVSWFAF
jgi:hypothetical protein